MILFKRKKNNTTKYFFFVYFKGKSIKYLLVIAMYIGYLASGVPVCIHHRICTGFQRAPWFLESNLPSLPKHAMAKFKQQAYYYCTQLFVCLKICYEGMRQDRRFNLTQDSVAHSLWWYLPFLSLYNFKFNYFTIINKKKRVHIFKLNPFSLFCLIYK